MTILNENIHLVELTYLWKTRTNLNMATFLYSDGYSGQWQTFQLWPNGYFPCNHLFCHCLNLQNVLYFSTHWKELFQGSYSISAIMQQERIAWESLGHIACTVSRTGIFAFLQALLLISFFIPFLQLSPFLLILVWLLRDTNEKCWEHSINKKYPPTLYVIPC